MFKNYCIFLFICIVAQDLTDICDTLDSSVCDLEQNPNCIWDSEQSTCREESFCHMDVYSRVKKVSDAMAAHGDLNTWEELLPMAKIFLESLEGLYSPNDFVGYPNDDFYMIGHCNWHGAGCQSKLSWDSQIPMIITFRNERIFNDYIPHAYAFFYNGTVGKSLPEEHEYEYFPTMRSWYLQGYDGWGQPYASFTDSELCQSFVYNGEDHTVGLDSNEVCHYEDITLIVTFKGWDICTPETPCAIAEGHCYTDDDCERGLTCFIRNMGNTERAGYDFSHVYNQIGTMAYDLNVCVEKVFCSSFSCSYKHYDSSMLIECVTGECDESLCCIAAAEHQYSRASYFACGIVILLYFLFLLCMQIKADPINPTFKASIVWLKFVFVVLDFICDVGFSLFLIDNGTYNIGASLAGSLIVNLVVGFLFFNLIDVKHIECSEFQTFRHDHRVFMMCMILMQGGATQFVSCLPFFPFFAPLSVQECEAMERLGLSLVLEHLPQIGAAIYYICYVAVEVHMFPMLQVVKGIIMIVYYWYSLIDRSCHEQYPEWKLFFTIENPQLPSLSMKQLPETVVNCFSRKYTNNQPGVRVEIINSRFEAEDITFCGRFYGPEERIKEIAQRINSNLDAFIDAGIDAINQDRNEVSVIVPETDQHVVNNDNPNSQIKELLRAYKGADWNDIIQFIYDELLTITPGFSRISSNDEIELSISAAWRGNYTPPIKRRYTVELASHMFNATTPDLELYHISREPGESRKHRFSSEKEPSQSGNHPAVEIHAPVIWDSDDSDHTIYVNAVMNTPSVVL